MFGRFLVGFLSVCAVGVVSADTLYMTKDDTSGNSSFQRWDACGVKGPVPSPGNKYINEEYKIRVPNATSATFGGDSLQLGDAAKNKSATLALSYNGNVSVSFPNDGLILSQGTIQPWFNGGCKTYTFTGTFDVRSPDTNPFKIYVGDNASHLGMTNVFKDVVFKGDAGTAVTIWNTVDNPDGYVILKPNASSTFKGQIILGNGTKALRCEPQGGGQTSPFPFGLHLTSYAQFLPPNGGTKWTLASLQLDKNSTLYTKLAGDDTSTITLTDSLTTAYPVNLTFPSARSIDKGTGRIWDVLKLPKAKMEMIHPEHFVLATQETVGLFPDVLPSVELRATEKDDFAVLELVQRQVVENKVADARGYSYSDQNFEFPTSMTNKFAWGNSNLPMATIDYVAAYDLNAAPTSQCTDGAYEFPGASLTVGKEKVFCEAAHEFTIPVLRLENKAQFWPLGELYDDATAVVKGRIHVLPTSGASDNPMIRVRRCSIVDIEAELTGTGNLQVQPNANNATNSVVVFDHDNSAFLGKIRITSNTYTNDMFTKGQTLVLKQANNVGGPLEAFTEDALEIRYFSTLKVTNDVEFATKNRGIRITTAGCIDVADGVAFVAKNAISLYGALTKSGAGELAVSSFVTNKNAAVIVAGGTLRPLAADALRDTSISFDGGALLVDTTIVSGDLATKGVDMTGMASPFGGALKVKFAFADGSEDHDIVDYPVCTVDSPAALAVSAVHVPRHGVRFARRSNGDGTDTVYATVFRTGMAVIIR